MRALTGGSSRAWGRTRGLSLIELMITILVLSVLMVVAVPSFRAVMVRADVANAINSLSADMQFARGQAARQHRYVSICRSTTGTGCQEAKSDPYDYDVGWIVYAYNVTASGPNQTFSATGSGMEILRYTSLLRGVSLRGKDGSIFTFSQTGEFVTTSGRNGLSFVACPRKLGAPQTQVGTNETGRQGSLLTLLASGSITVVPLPLTSSCFP